MAVVKKKNNKCIKEGDYFCTVCDVNQKWSHCKACRDLCNCNENRDLKELLKQSIKDIDNRKNLTNYLMDKYSPVLKRLSKT